MAALVATIATFFSGVMGMVSTLTTTIVGDDLLVLGVVAVPLVGISVGLVPPVPSACVTPDQLHRKEFLLCLL